MSAANPSVGQPTVNDKNEQTGLTHAHQAKLRAGASSSAICDGCQGAATTLQVVTLDRATKAVADNVATAWSTQCTTCGASALSVQVVLARRVTDLVVANRALAVNAACAGCDSAAAAVQLVVIDPRRYALTKEGQALVDQIRAQLADRLKAASTPQRAGARALTTSPGGDLQSDVDASVQRLRDALGSDLGSADIQVHTDVHSS